MVQASRKRVGGCEVGSCVWTGAQGQPERHKLGRREEDKEKMAWGTRGS